MNVQNMLKRTFWVVGVLMLLVGGVGWYLRIKSGHQDANYGSIVRLLAVSCGRPS